MFSRLYNQWNSTATTVGGISTLLQVTDYYNQRKNLSMDLYPHPRKPFRAPIALWEHLGIGYARGYYWPITLVGHIAWQITGGETQTFYFASKEQFDRVRHAESLRTAFFPSWNRGYEFRIEHNSIFTEKLEEEVETTSKTEIKYTLRY